MKYTSIPLVNKPVSRIVLGSAGKLFTSGCDVREVIEAALDSGINCVDSARAYRKSEEAIDRYLQQGGQRDELVLISKCCHPTLRCIPRVTPGQQRTI